MCFFDFYGFKDVLVCINRFCGYKFIEKLGETEEELVEDGVTAHRY
jgi:hypothetical protein